MHILVDAAGARGWQIRVVATPSAVGFLDITDLEERTGAPVRSQHRAGGQPAANRPAADAIVIAPATFNMVNKLAAGIADNYALTFVGERIGTGIPIVVLPFVNTAYASRRPYLEGLAGLHAEAFTFCPTPMVCRS